MNRRTLVLAGLSTLTTAALATPLDARRRPTHQARAKRAARRQQGGVVASHVRTRIVTRTFTSSVPLTLADVQPAPAVPYPSTIQVSGFNQGRILNVRPTLIGLSHTFPGELDILLVAPGNVGVMILSDAGGAADVSGVSLTFDQNAPGAVPDQLVSGTYQPSNLGAEAADPLPPPAPPGVSGHSLTRFTNRNPNGAWRLFVFDEASGGTGALAGWSLQIRARVRVTHRHRRSGGPRRPSPA
jgi:subtilisin-like proprotein convertase family protein